MNRELRPEMDREPPSGERARRERIGALQFLREVRTELRKVAWPSRREVASYSLVVLVVVSLLTALIFGLDQAFGQFVFWIFG